MRPCRKRMRIAAPPLKPNPTPTPPKPPPPQLCPCTSLQTLTNQHQHHNNTPSNSHSQNMPLNENPTTFEAELEERARVAEEWATSIVDPTQLYGQAAGVFLWEGCLRLLQCCELDEPMVARKLIRCVCPSVRPYMPPVFCHFFVLLLVSFYYVILAFGFSFWCLPSLRMAFVRVIPGIQHVGYSLAYTRIFKRILGISGGKLGICGCACGRGACACCSAAS